MFLGLIHAHANNYRPPSARDVGAGVVCARVTFRLVPGDGRPGLSLSVDDFADDLSRVGGGEGGEVQELREGGGGGVL